MKVIKVNHPMARKVEVLDFKGNDVAHITAIEVKLAFLEGMLSITYFDHQRGKRNTITLDDPNVEMYLTLTDDLYDVIMQGADD